MLLKIAHETKLTYSNLIAETVMELRVAPRQEPQQHRLAFELAIGPAAPVESYFDFLGNLVHAFSVNAPHKELHITAASVVQTSGAISPAELEDLYDPGARHDYTLLDYLQFGGIVVQCAELDALARGFGVRRGARLWQVCEKIMNHINSKYEYKKGVTTAASPITDILKLNSGVCQDFTHLMIGICRALGIPARYVSGFIYSGDQGYRGASQSHAWCEVYFPVGGHWIGFDPTNNCVAGTQFVKVAVGRDYHDIPPNRGVFRGRADETMDVRVDIKQLSQLPTKLRAEFISGLNVPVFGNRNGQAWSVDGTVHDQQQQQQQQEQQQQQQQQ